MKHTAYFGDAEYTFALTDAMIHELEFKTGAGIGGLYQRIASGTFHFSDLIEVIRCGLIGGGTDPQTAQRLVDAYAKPAPILTVFSLALDVLDARWSAPAAPSDAPIGQADNG